MKYIAYGLNMVTHDMAYRCPGAKLIGMGKLLNTVYEFRGCATVRRCENEAEAAAHPFVPVAVWEIDEQDERALDRFESYPAFYRKELWTATMDDGSEIKGMIYLMNTAGGQNPIHLPPPSYYAAVTKAYVELGLEQYLPIIERARAFAMTAM